MLNKDQAVCLRAIDFSETSQVVTLFTRDNGKIDAMAKGSRRHKSAFEGPIETFSYGSIIFSPARQAGLSHLTEFYRKPLFFHSSATLLALNAAVLAAELADGFTTDFDPHPQLFDTFIQFLKDIQQCRSDTRALALLVLFELALLEHTGTGLVLDRCANCALAFGCRQGFVYFSSRADGLVCRDCEQSFTDRIKLAPKAAQVLTDPKLLPGSDYKTIISTEKVLIGHFAQLLGKMPKSAKFFLQG